MCGSFVISLILEWALATVGHLALFIIASVLQIICCLSYYLVAVYVKKQAGNIVETTEQGKPVEETK
jgi:dipeptide/tripeptide permease